MKIILLFGILGILAVTPLALATQWQEGQEEQLAEQALEILEAIREGDGHAVLGMHALGVESYPSESDFVWRMDKIYEIIDKHGLPNPNWFYIDDTPTPPGTFMLATDYGGKLKDQYREFEITFFFNVGEPPTLIYIDIYSLSRVIKPIPPGLGGGDSTR